MNDHFDNRLSLRIKGKKKDKCRFKISAIPVKLSLPAS